MNKNVIIDGRIDNKTAQIERKLNGQIKKKVAEPTKREKLPKMNKSTKPYKFSPLKL